MRLASVLMGWCLLLMRRRARQLKELTTLAHEDRRLGGEPSAVEALLSCCLPTIIAIIIPFLIERSNGIEGFPAFITTTLTKRFNVSET